MSSPAHDPDVDLLRSMAAGSVQALDQLYTRQGSAILSYLTLLLNDRSLAEEVLQDVMLAAWKHAGDFRGESRVRTWLLSIARNRAINATRKHRLPVVSLDDAFEAASGDTGPLERVERNAMYANLRSAINRLPAIQREILTLVFFHQLSGAEVANILGITPGTVKSRLHRAKEALRRELNNEGIH